MNNKKKKKTKQNKTNKGMCDTLNTKAKCTIVILHIKLKQTKMKKNIYIY